MPTQTLLFDRACAERFNQLALRRGVALTGLARHQADLNVVMTTLLYFVSAQTQYRELTRDEFFVRVDVFLTEQAPWLKTTPLEIIEAMHASGAVTVRPETVTMRIEAEAQAPTLVQTVALWAQLDDERAKRRARIRAQLQEKNRKLNAAKGSPIDPEMDRRFMQEALRMAHAAREAGEVPVGAVIAMDGTIVAQAYNCTVGLHDPTAHAEMMAIRKAAANLGNERLNGAVLYVTLEPCAMCAGAIAHARIARVVWGADDPSCGSMRSVLDVAESAHMNHRAQHTPDVLRAECEAILNRFFKERRQAQKVKSKDGSQA